MAIMLQDLALLTPIIDDIVHLLKCMLLIEEFQGHPAAANGCPRLAIFRTVEAYVRPMASGEDPYGLLGVACARRPMRCEIVRATTTMLN